ncbi:hypothetical protein MMC31_003576, partial [Peltigera leucophlebia]|nr:hypothetical protein [Peltigera leucophlebia]
MRFRASIKEIGTFSKLTASLLQLGRVVWIRLDDEQVRFTVLPEQGPGTQDKIFDNYTIQSAAPLNTINLQVPLAVLNRALRSALFGSSASIRLTKQDNLPVLSLTIITNTYSASRPAQIAAFATSDDGDGDGREDGETGNSSGLTESGGGGYSDRETTITQSVPVMVLPAATVSGIHEPRCRDPDVHIMLPPLSQLKSISDRFTKLALSTSSSSGGLFGTAGVSSSSQQPQPFASLASSSRLVLSANMHGALRIGVTTAALKIESKWEGLINP